VEFFIDELDKKVSDVLVSTEKSVEILVETQTLNNDTSNKKLTLEEQLKKAVDNENYELAVKLRDKIKSK
jgi:protein-arginine kinase activator protein McsA